VSAVTMINFFSVLISMNKISLGVFEAAVGQRG
jgi:hypothetical protein